MSGPGIEAASLYVTIGDRGVDATVSGIQKVGTMVDKIAGSHGEATISANVTGAESNIDKANSLVEKYGHSSAASELTANIVSAEANVNKIDADIAKFVGMHPETKLLFDKNPAVRAIGEVETKVRELKAQASQKITMTINAIVKGGSNLGANALLGGGLNMKSVGATALQAIGQGGGAGGAVAAMGGPLAIGGAAIAAIGGLALGKAGEMEKFETQLSVLLGSVEKAHARIAELTQFAATTPFELPQVVEASKVLQVFTGDALSTGKGLQLVGDVAAGTGSDFGETAMWFGRMYDAMKSGKPFGEATMRLQEMGAMGGKSREKIEKLAAGVKDGSMTMEQAWAQASGEFSRFGGMMDKQSGTLEGKLSNLSDAIGQDFAKIGTFLLPVAKIVVDVLVAGFSILGTVIGVVGNAVTMLLQPFLFLGGILGNLASGPIKFVGDALGTVSNILGGIGDFVGQVGDNIKQTFESVDKAAQRANLAAVSAARAADDSTTAAESMKNHYEIAAKTADKSAAEIIAANNRIIASELKLRDTMLKDAGLLVSGYYDVLITKDKLLATQAEIAANKRILASHSASTQQKADAASALHQLAKDNIDYLEQLAAAGGSGSKIVQKAMSDYIKTLSHAHGEERAAINAEIIRLEIMAAKAYEAEKAFKHLASGSFHGNGGKGGDANRAGGGYAIGGHAYQINENTPNSEIFVPSGNGYILPGLSKLGSMPGGGGAPPQTSGGYGGHGGGVAIFPIRIDASAAMTPAVAMQIVQALGPLLGPWLRQAGFIPQGTG